MHFYPIRLLKFLFLINLCIIISYLISYRLNNSNIESISTEIKLLTFSTLPSFDEFNEISLTLEPFTIFLPHFSDDEARDWFLKSTYYKMNSKQCQNNSCEKNGFLFDNPKEHLNVRTAFIKNGLYLNDDCGYNYNDQDIRRIFTSTNQTSIIYDKAIIYTVPDGWSFQHFLDGIGPKLSHSRIYLDKYPDAKVIIRQGMRFDSSVQQIWALLGIKESNRLIHYQSNTKLGARLLINPCRTPGIHPKLWQNAREIYWSLANISISNSILLKNKLIYLQRTPDNSKNPGRRILNEDLFIEVLRQYAKNYSLEFFLYDHSKQQNNIIKQIELFYQASIIIGVHGGAHSNMNFAQSGTKIIEIMPYRSEQNTIPIVCRLSYPNELKPCVGYIYYTQSQLLNHSYWILPTPVNNDKNLLVNLTRIKQLFDIFI